MARGSHTAQSTGKKIVVRTGGSAAKSRRASWKLWYVIPFIVAFAALGGGYLIFQSHAATPTLPDPLYNGGQAPWNQPIGTNPTLDPNSAAMVSAVDSRVNPTMNAFGMPLYTSTASDPTCTVTLTGGGDEPFDSDQPIHVPANAAASTGDDHWLFIYDSTKNLIFEMWEASKSGNCFTANTGNVYSPTGDGVLQPNGQTQDGNGSSYFAGVVSAQDWARGYINHALSLAAQATLSNQGRYPMNKSTDGNSNGTVPMGARFFLDKSVNCDGLGASKVETMVCHAMQTYGAYMHDTGGVPMSIYFQEDTSAGGIWSAAGWNENMTFSKIPWNQMHVLASWNSYTPTSPPPAPSPTPSPSPSPSPKPTPSPAPKSNPSPTPSPSPRPVSPSSPSNSPSPASSTSSDTQSPESSGSTSTVPSTCHAGQVMQGSTCVCTSGTDSFYCAFITYTSPALNILAIFIALLYLIRLLLGIKNYRKFGSNPQWAVYSKAQIVSSVIAIIVVGIIYVVLRAVIRAKLP